MSPWGSAVNHLQPPQSLYQNEDDNPRINFCDYIEVRFKVYWPESSSKVSESKISKLNSWSLDCFYCDPPPWRGSWDWEEQNPYLFRSRSGRNRKIQSDFFATDRVDFRPLVAYLVAQFESQSMQQGVKNRSDRWQKNLTRFFYSGRSVTGKNYGFCSSQSQEPLYCSGSQWKQPKLQELSFEILVSETFEPDFGQYTLNRTSM